MNMNKVQTYFPALALSVAVLLAGTPVQASAMEVGVWVPWFQAKQGAESATKNIKKIDTVYPFVYEVVSDGSLINKVSFSDRHWRNLFRAADRNKVPVIPTIAWFNGTEIHTVLSNQASRRRHIAEIVKVVNDNKFAGINIDYENKRSETKDHFSTFLQELDTALKSKTLTCAIEARTPPDSLHRVVPATIAYANDYEVINRHCDRVEIMTYDQQRADIKLNDIRRGVPYMPVADKDWVEKVIELAIQDIDKDKILLGVPTYGRAWDVTVAPEWYKDYTRVATLNQPRILELAKKYKSPVGRSAGGEAVISYFPDDSPFRGLDKNRVPRGTPKGFEAAAKALAAANSTGKEVSVRFITWSDAKAIEDKFDLIDQFGLKGTAIFKVDGEEDPGIWRLIK